MIRFCDKEVCCVTENEMDWQQMVDYFLDYGMNEKIYILNEGGGFTGRIDYNSLFGAYSETAIEKKRVTLRNGKDIWISKDCVILDDKIWENGRRYFSYFSEGLLPVLNKKRELLCFAWNDEEANREIRMLYELSSCKDTLSFTDLFPETECLSVNGLNELAYFFARYLEKIGVPVNVNREYWDIFGTWEKTEIPEYKNYSVDGERRTGMLQEQATFRESVSAGFVI